MPELPEVETIARDLKKELNGKKIKAVGIINSYKVLPGKAKFLEALNNVHILEVNRIAKVIVCKLSNGNYLTFHLAMTGRLLYRKTGTKEDLHLRVRLQFTDGYELRFTDVRMFGYAKVISQEELETLKFKYGPTPFSKSLTPEKFLEIIAQRKTQIKRALLEQDLIAGLGNIYANDSLWMAKIHPEKETTKLTKTEAFDLITAMKAILTEGIEHRGSTLSDLMYVDIYGEIGSHQKHFRVYGKDGKPCARCNETIRMIAIGGRSTFYCPNCQRL